MTQNKTPWYELDWDAAQLAPLLASGAPLLPELEAARANPAALRAAPSRCSTCWLEPAR